MIDCGPGSPDVCLCACMCSQIPRVLTTSQKCFWPTSLNQARCLMRLNSPMLGTVSVKNSLWQSQSRTKHPLKGNLKNPFMKFSWCVWSRTCERVTARLFQTCWERLAVRRAEGRGCGLGGGAPIFEGRVFLNSAILHGARVYLWLERILWRLFHVSLCFVSQHVLHLCSACCSHFDKPMPSTSSGRWQRGASWCGGWPCPSLPV